MPRGGLGLMRRVVVIAGCEVWGDLGTRWLSRGAIRLCREIGIVTGHLQGLGGEMDNVCVCRCVV